MCEENNTPHPPQACCYPLHLLSQTSNHTNIYAPWRVLMGASSNFLLSSPKRSLSITLPSNEQKAKKKNGELNKYRFRWHFSVKGLCENKLECLSHLGRAALFKMDERVRKVWRDGFPTKGKRVEMLHAPSGTCGWGKAWEVCSTPSVCVCVCVCVCVYLSLVCVCVCVYL